MRIKFIILALNFSALTGMAHAQLAPTKPLGSSVAPGAAAGAPLPVGFVPASPAAVQAFPPPPAGARSTAGRPGIVTLSDVARQSEQPAPSTAQTGPEVPAITLVDSSNKAMTEARQQLRAEGALAIPAKRKEILLARISRSDYDANAVLYVKGQNRKVFSGSRVLQYTVGEIKEDGVCLYPAKGNAKNKCSTLVTFN